VEGKGKTKQQKEMGFFRQQTHKKTSPLEMVTNPISTSSFYYREVPGRGSIANFSNLVSIFFIYRL